eukprot:Seg182.7 transcript_id=Seg182.7/GoldUCD/mRNA.D3Y31 product="hypothetical protein" protein_id=Seg182.7/GoldUCD/D3Y31
MAPRKRFKQCTRNVKICAPGISRVKKVLYIVNTPNRSSHSPVTSSLADGERTFTLQDKSNNSLGQHGGNQQQAAQDHDQHHQSTADHGVLASKRDGLSQYERRKLREEDAWEDIREKLKSTHFKQQFLPNSPCVVCLFGNDIHPKESRLSLP